MVRNVQSPPRRGDHRPVQKNLSACIRPIRSRLISLPKLSFRPVRLMVRNGGETGDAEFVHVQQVIPDIAALTK